MPGTGEIGPYQNKVASEIKKILGEAATFFPSISKKKLEEISVGDEVVFDLVHRDQARSEQAVKMRREESQIKRVSVFSLCTRSSICLGTFWVSWHEVWLKQDQRNLILQSAGWTLFEGLPGNQDKTQILRADWDQIPQMGSRNAGHPHWHFDHDLFVSTELEKIESKRGLVEITADSSGGIDRQTSLGFVHLAMGAWNGDLDHPECWQRTYEDDCRNLRDWCVKTLIYLKEQVGGVVNG